MQYKNITFIIFFSSCSVPLVDLLGGCPVTSHGQHQTIVIEFSHSLHILAAVLPSLVGDESVALHGDGGRNLPPVRGGLVKLLTQPELQLDALHGGLGDHGPVPTSLSD